MSQQRVWKPFPFLVQSNPLRLKANPHYGRARAQAVSRRPIAAEARVRAQGNPCGICGGLSGADKWGKFFSEIFYRCSMFTHVSSGDWTMGPLAATVHRHILLPS
jgi:hypothetical protein